MNCSVAFFEWLHIRVSSSDLKVQCSLYIIIDMIACHNIAQWLLFEWSHVSKGCIHIYFSKLVQLTFRRFKEVSAVHKEVSRLVRIHPTAVAQLPEALQVTRSSQQDIEIIPWKVRANDFYSQVTMHLKKKMIENSYRVSFFYASQRLNKNRLSTFHDMMFLFHMFLEMTDKFQRMEVNDCENTSFVQSETRTKVLHNVNL